MITQHSGEGKANQYQLRGFQLDHGTDFAITLDGMPLNMPTHGHGQGYADANFLIPELMSYVVARKGPYFADEGDFSSAGAVYIYYKDEVPKGLFTATMGSFDYGRLLAIDNTKLNGGNLLSAIELGIYNGPWTVPDQAHKINGVWRWSQGTPDNGLSIDAMAYANRWHATDQIARARSHARLHLARGAISIRPIAATRRASASRGAGPRRTRRAIRSSRPLQSIRRSTSSTTSTTTSPSRRSPISSTNSTAASSWVSRPSMAGNTSSTEFPSRRVSACSRATTTSASASRTPIGRCPMTR